MCDFIAVQLIDSLKRHLESIANLMNIYVMYIVHMHNLPYFRGNENEQKVIESLR